MNLNLSFRRVYAVTVIAVGLLLLTACNITGGSAPKSLAGSWKDGTFTATVDATSIEVYWTSDDTKSLYWVGTFDGNKKPKNGLVVVSTGDVNQMQDALMASQSTEKVFTYKDGTINFDLSVAGTQRTIHLTKES